MDRYSDNDIAVMLYALQEYEDCVDGDRTNSFEESFYALLYEFKTEYDRRNLNWKVFWKHEP